MISEGCSVASIPTYKELAKAPFLLKKKLSHYTSRWKTKELMLIKYGYMQMAEKTLYEGHRMSSQKWYTSHSAVNY